MWSIYLSFLLGLGTGYGIWKLEYLRIWRDSDPQVQTIKLPQDRKVKGG